MQRLRFEGNSLEREVPQGLSELMGLEDLDLSRNRFSGPIPSFLSNFSIKQLNMSYNRLRGEVPMQGIFVNNNTVFLYGNNELCGGILELKLPPCSLSNSSEKNELILLKKIMIPSVCLLFAISFGLLMLLYSRKEKNNSFSRPYLDTKFIRLSYADLKKATDVFSRANLIGIGNFGIVYKGILENRKILVAVKVLFNLSTIGASNSFMAEFNVLRCIKHRNLVKILSICKSIDFQQNDFKALIYAYKANGSLNKWLYHEKKQGEGENDADSRTLSTFQRINIAIDIAHALEYLHYGTDSCIVHGDLKPSNILLDHDLNAFVGDFGLARIVSSMNLMHESNSSASINGTIDYIAPEYATSYTISIQGDVYSYGILLLEMFTNKSPIDEGFHDHNNLHNHVCNALQDNVMRIVDPLIRIEHDTDNRIEDCVVYMLSIGVECSRYIPSDRILMTDVVNELSKIRDSYMCEDLYQEL